MCRFMYLISKTELIFQALFFSLLGVTTIIVAARIFLRLRYGLQKLYAEDYFVILAFVHHSSPIANADILRRTSHKSSVNCSTRSDMAQLIRPFRRRTSQSSRSTPTPLVGAKLVLLFPWLRIIRIIMACKSFFRVLLRSNLMEYG